MGKRQRRRLRETPTPDGGNLLEYQKLRKRELIDEPYHHERGNPFAEALGLAPRRRGRYGPRPSFTKTPPIKRKLLNRARTKRARASTRRNRR